MKNVIEYNPNDIEEYIMLAMPFDNEHIKEKAKNSCYTEKQLIAINILLRQLIDKSKYLSFLISRIQIFQNNIREQKEENKNHKDFLELQKRYLKLKNSHDLFLDELKSFLKETEETNVR